MLARHYLQGMKILGQGLYVASLAVMAGLYTGPFLREDYNPAEMFLILPDAALMILGICLASRGASELERLTQSQRTRVTDITLKEWRADYSQ